jgi:hypothetical protein
MWNVCQMCSAYLSNQMFVYVISISTFLISDMAKNTKYGLSAQLLLSKTESVEEEYELTLNKDVFGTVHVATGQALKCMNAVHPSCQF